MKSSGKGALPEPSIFTIQKSAAPTLACDLSPEIGEFEMPATMQLPSEFAIIERQSSMPLPPIVFSHSRAPAAFNFTIQ